MRRWGIEFPERVRSPHLQKSLLAHPSFANRKTPQQLVFSNRWQIFNKAALGSMILRQRKAGKRESVSQKKPIRALKAPTSGLFCLAAHNIFRTQDRVCVNNSN
ncbi:hypothetical protein D0A37_23300 [Microcoleus vaginatus HSN003]|nr:hypothetical protein D0A37_23300 [Microcoleus vaginatus HSN003]